MSGEEKVLELQGIRDFHEVCFKVCAETRSPMGMAVSMIANADELAPNAIRRRRFFFLMGNG